MQLAEAPAKVAVEVGPLPVSTPTALVHSDDCFSASEHQEVEPITGEEDHGCDVAQVNARSKDVLSGAAQQMTKDT